MPVTPSSYEALTVAAAITMLASSTTFQTLVGAVSVATAKAKIIESWGGNPGRTGGKGKATATDGTQFVMAPPYALVHQSEMSSSIGGISSYDYSGNVAIEIHLARVSGNEAPPDTFVRGRNTMGAIRSEMQALFGATNCLATGSVDSAGPTLPEDSGADGAELIADLSIEWIA